MARRDDGVGLHTAEATPVEDERLAAATSPPPVRRTCRAGKGAPRSAKSTATSCCRRERMLTTNRPLLAMAASVREPWPSETRTSSGSSETDVNELSVMPAGSPSTSAVTTVTPVANSPTHSRNAIVGIAEVTAITDTVSNVVRAADQTGFAPSASTAK